MYAHGDLWRYATTGSHQKSEPWQCSEMWPPVILSAVACLGHREPSRSMDHLARLGESDCYCGSRPRSEHESTCSLHIHTCTCGCAHTNTCKPTRLLTYKTRGRNMPPNLALSKEQLSMVCGASQNPISHPRPCKDSGRYPNLIRKPTYLPPRRKLHQKASLALTQLSKENSLRCLVYRRSSQAVKSARRRPASRMKYQVDQGSTTTTTTTTGCSVKPGSCVTGPRGDESVLRVLEHPMLWPERLFALVSG